jgi:hypothetical protein
MYKVGRERLSGLRVESPGTSSGRKKLAFVLTEISPRYHLERHRSGLSVRSVGSGSSSNFRLPLITVSEELLLVVEQLFAGLGGVFSVGGYSTMLVITQVNKSDKTYFQQWHQLGNSPGSTRSRCTWSYQYHIGSSGDFRPLAPLLQW